MNATTLGDGKTPPSLQDAAIAREERVRLAEHRLQDEDVKHEVEELIYAEVEGEAVRVSAPADQGGRPSPDRSDRLASDTRPFGRISPEGGWPSVRPYTDSAMAMVEATNRSLSHATGNLASSIGAAMTATTPEQVVRAQLDFLLGCVEASYASSLAMLVGASRAERSFGEILSSMRS